MDGALQAVTSQITKTAFDTRGWLDAFQTIPGNSTTDFVVREIDERAAQAIKRILKEPESQGASSPSHESQPEEANSSLSLPKATVTIEEELIPIGIYTKGVGFDFGAKAIGVCAMRGLVTYMALERCWKISLYCNGGAAFVKCAIAILTVLGRVVSIGDKDNYGKAQDLLEEGFFHLLTVVYDYAVSQFSMIRTAYSVFYAVAPSAGLTLNQMFYRPFKGAIQQQMDSSADVKQKVRKEFCIIQVGADFFQELLLPSSTGIKEYFANLMATFTKRLGDQTQKSS